MLSGFLITLSFLLTIVIRIILLRHKILDIPNERSSHSVPTPKGGGLAIVLTWFVGISIMFFYKSINSNLYFALLCGLPLAIISLLDDILNLKPVIRFFIQVFVAISAIILLREINPIEIFGLEIKSWLVLHAIAIIGIVWFINLFNFMDGIDGYASMEAITITIAIYFINGNPINLILIASVLGFLFWNWPKAKVFMGDIGSTQLGFVLIILGIYFNNTSELSIIHWIMLSSLFWFDATLTLFRRWKNKEKLTIAHRKHAYQRAVQSGLSHQKTIIISVGFNLAIIGLVLTSIKYPSLGIPLFIFNMLLLYGITIFIDKKVSFSNKL